MGLGVTEVVVTSVGFWLGCGRLVPGFGVGVVDGLGYPVRVRQSQMAAATAAVPMRATMGTARVRVRVVATQVGAWRGLSCWRSSRAFLAGCIPSVIGSAGDFGVHG